MGTMVLEGEACMICRGARCRECGGLGTLAAYLDTQAELGRRTIIEQHLGIARVEIERASEALARLGTPEASEPAREVAAELRGARDHLESAADLLSGD